MNLLFETLPVKSQHGKDARGNQKACNVEAKLQKAKAKKKHK